MSQVKVSVCEDSDLVIDHARQPPPAWPEEAKPPSKTHMQKRKTATLESPARLFGFADPEEIKRNIRTKMLSQKKAYSVFDFYYASGVFQYIAKHPLFENATLAVISLNAVYIAVDTDWNKDKPLEAFASNDLEESHFFFQFMEHAFCTYFTLEWIIRFAAFKNKCNCFRDAWFVFDSLLVLLMVFETWVLLLLGKLIDLADNDFLGNTSVLRLFRLLRLSRLLRMLRSLPELMMLIRGMMQAMTSVFYVMCLLVIITYVFGIAFTQLAVGTAVGETYFANVSLSMYSLLIHATFMDDLAAFTNDLRFEMWPLLALALVFCCIASLTLMNMLVGVLCEVVAAVAASEKEEMLAEKMVSQMRTLLQAVDENGDGVVSYAEFAKLMEKEEAIACLKEQAVNPLQVIDSADMFFFEDGKPVKITFEDFMEMLMNLRETNQATVKDIWNMSSTVKAFFSKDTDRVEKQLEVVNKKIDNLEQKMNQQMSTILAEIQHINQIPRVKVNTSGNYGFKELPGTIRPRVHSAGRPRGGHEDRVPHEMIR